MKLFIKISKKENQLYRKYTLGTRDKNNQIHKLLASIKEKIEKTASYYRQPIQ